MGYRKFSGEREAKRVGFQPDPVKTREMVRTMDNNDINRLIKDGEPLFSSVMAQYGYNAVARATEPAPGRKQRKRRVYDREHFTD